MACRTRLRSIQAFSEAIQTELLIGELLLRLDRPVDAESVLRTVLGGLPQQSDLVLRAAWLLAQALNSLGRAAEAVALRAQYDLPADEPDELDDADG